MVIRNPEKYNAAQKRKATKRQVLVDSTFWNIIEIIDDSHAGKLEARNKVEALDILIRFGVFGASSKFPVRVSRYRKQEHHQNISQAAPTEIPEEYKKWYALVLEALGLLESARTITIDDANGAYVISTTTQPKKSAIQEDLERRYGTVVEQPETDADETYHPSKLLTARQYRVIDDREKLAYR